MVADAQGGRQIMQAGRMAARIENAGGADDVNHLDIGTGVEEAPKALGHHGVIVHEH